MNVDTLDIGPHVAAITLRVWLGQPWQTTFTWTDGGAWLEEPWTLRCGDIEHEAEVAIGEAVFNIDAEDAATLVASRSVVEILVGETVVMAGRALEARADIDPPDAQSIEVSDGTTAVELAIANGGGGGPGGGVTVHSGLTGRSEPEQHPATAIAAVPGVAPGLRADEVVEAWEDVAAQFEIDPELVEFGATSLAVLVVEAGGNVSEQLANAAILGLAALAFAARGGMSLALETAVREAADSDLGVRIDGLPTFSDVATAVAALADSAPETLNTLNELAAALGDDPNFAATVTTALAAKVPTARMLAGLDLSADRSAAAFRTALGLVIGTDVQAYSAALATLAGITPGATGQALLAATTAAAARTTIGVAHQRTTVILCALQRPTLAGSTTFAFSTSAVLGSGYANLGPGALPGDIAASWPVWLDTGTHALTPTIRQTANSAEMTVLLDGVSLGAPIPGYFASSRGDQQPGSYPGIVVNTPGWYTVTITNPTRNGSSGGFGLTPQALTFVRTGP